MTMTTDAMLDTSRILKLAAEIRRVDGGHKCGAAELAERLMPFIDAHIAEECAKVVDAERYQWLRENIQERPTDGMLKGGEFAEHKTQYALPKLIAWADFCGQISLDDAIDAALANSEEGGA